ncbi:MAG: glycosyltransferase family 2 protein [Candidatus Aenigmatarchaeota archaeon]|nr:MAG: glycosyltransferase family 2 protein [Candidatus Aenigmarchaeota archaeon]
MKKNKVSVSIITLNEERDLPECLESVKWADEIVVVDSFSSDKTVEIAKKFGCKIFQEDAGGRRLAILKNYAISKTRKDWVLSLDADEVITPELRKETEEVLKNPKFDGYYFPRKSYIGKKWVKHAGQYPSYQLRLFKKDRGRFENSLVHERVKINGKVGYMKNDMIHYNFDSWGDVIEKQLNKLTTLEAEMLAGKRFVWFYPLGKIRGFFREYSRLREMGNNRRTSYVLSRRVFSGYEIKWLIPFRPFTTFFRLYFIMQGFRDGVYGLAWCLLTSVAVPIKFFKYHELKKKLSGKPEKINT